MATEAAKQQASMQKLSAGGEGRSVGRVDDAQQQKLAAAIQKTADAEYLADQARQQRCVR